MAKIKSEKRTLSFLWFLAEQPRSFKEPQMPEILAVSRIARAFEGVIGEYPKGKGPEQTVTQDGKEVTGRTWRFDYPGDAEVEIDSEDRKLLRECWGKWPKDNFLSDPELRSWACSINDSLQD